MCQTKQATKGYAKKHARIFKSMKNSKFLVHRPHEVSKYISNLTETRAGRKNI